MLAVLYKVLICTGVDNNQCTEAATDAKIIPWPVTEHERQLLRKQLESDTDNLQQEFAKLVASTSMHMKTTHVETAVLVLAIISYDASLKLKFASRWSYARDFVFVEASHYWSFYDFSLLKIIIEATLNDNTICVYDVEKLLRRYINLFKDYCSRRLCKSPSNGADASEQTSEVVMLIDDRMNLKECTWQDLQKLQDIASQVTGVRIEGLYSCTNFKKIETADDIMQQEASPSKKIRLEEDSCSSTDSEISDIELRGVDKLSETELVVEDSWDFFQWNGYGLKARIQPDSLPTDVDSCTITIKASLSGQYQLPPNTHLVSPVFWLHCTPRCKFNFPVTLEIQHCAPLKNSFRLFMAGASSAQKDLPYSFKVLHGGSFSENISYGTIDLSQFGGIAVVQERADERRYWSNVFAMGPANHKTVHFTVTWDDEAHITVSLLLII